MRSNLCNGHSPHGTMEEMLHSLIYCSYNFDHSPSSLVIDFSICLIKIIMNYVTSKTHSMQFVLGVVLPKMTQKMVTTSPKGMYIYVYNIFTILRFDLNDIVSMIIQT
jgi:hypothetical protein